MVRVRHVNANAIITASNKRKAKRKPVNLADYIAQKVKTLQNKFGISFVTVESFDGCTSEIAVDNRARSIILNRI